MKNIPFENIDITGGFWKQKQDLNKTVTLRAVYERFKETGRIDAFACSYKDGDEIQPHIFWDSDVAKWIEAVGYVGMKDDISEYEPIIDEIADNIEKNAMEDGYFNSYYLTIGKGKRFTDRNCHELYCLGHLIEGAISYYRATGKDKLLNSVKKYADLVKKLFMDDRSAAFVTTGHQELEIALVKLYELTNEKKYLDLAYFFIQNRGKTSGKPAEDSRNNAYYQSHKPVYEQDSAVGHAVRAVYMYTAMADLSKLYNDEPLKQACGKLFSDIIDKKMFITGSVGSNSVGESFGAPYYLPNINAYAETCAALGLCFFAHRMNALNGGADRSTVYADTIERAFYNGAMSGLSLSGDRFFYENPLELSPEVTAHNNMHYPIPERVAVFQCSCCPPNINRFIATVGNYFYAVEDGTVFINQFAESTAEFDTGNGKVKIVQKTDYPCSGKVSVTYYGERRVIAIRVPFWSDAYESTKASDGYIYYYVSDGETVELDFDMKVEFIEANPLVYDNSGKAAVMRGPVVYCAEEKDNGKNLSDITVDINDTFTPEASDRFVIPTLHGKAFRRKKTGKLYYSARSSSYESADITLIPYYAFANRGVGEMRVWLGRRLDRI